jgi:aminoglycoside phosphotransferase (APT) family kinase protein
MFVFPQRLASRADFRLMSRLRVLLFRDKYSRISGFATTSALGFVFWVLAARLYTTESVGVNSALLAAAIFVANLSHLNLTTALNRLLPGTGEATGRLIVRFYLTGLATALAAGLAFSWFAGMWLSARGIVESGPFGIPGFTVATVTWCMFVLQDSAIAGLQRGVRPPIETMIFTFTKIVLLIGFAGLLPRFGIIASWTISVLVVVLPANILIFRILVPAHAGTAEGRTEPAEKSPIAGFVAGDHIATVIGTAPLIVLPLMVLVRDGATSTAYYSVPWAMAYALYLVGRNAAAQLPAEDAADGIRLNMRSWRGFVRSARLVVPVAVLLAVGAPYLLRLFGPGYAAEGTVLLRLVCLSAIPHLVVASYLGVLRAQQRTRVLILVAALLSLFVLAFSHLLFDLYGINGIGLAWLVSQTAVALVVYVFGLGSYWLPHMNVQFLLRPLAIPRELSWHWRKSRIKAETAGFLPDVLSRVIPLVATPHPTNWRVQGQARTVNDVAVVTLGPEGHPPVALLKLPQSGSAVASLKKQNKLLTTLSKDHRLGPWRALLPVVLAEGDTDGHYFVVERMKPGHDLRTLLDDPVRRARIRTAAAKTIGFLHRRTAASVEVNNKMLERWVDEPVSRIKDALGGSRASKGYQKALDNLTDQLHGSLVGKTIAVSWVHGDFTPGNILVASDTGRVTGILDWDQAAPEDLPLLDLAMLFLSMRMLERRCELGEIVGEMLAGAEWTSGERVLLNTARESLSGDAVGTRELVLLAWLRHIGANLSKSTRYSGHRLWTAKNIEAVLLRL